MLRGSVYDTDPELSQDEFHAAEPGDAALEQSFVVGGCTNTFGHPFIYMDGSPFLYLGKTIR
jgi:hypothetical protein